MSLRVNTIDTPKELTPILDPKNKPETTDNLNERISEIIKVIIEKWSVIEGLLEKGADQKKINKEMEVINTKNLKNYYDQFLKLLRATFVASESIYSGKVANSEKYTSDHVANVVSVAGSCTGIPTGFITGIISLFTSRQKALDVKRITDFFTQDEDALDIIKRLARRITLANKEVIESWKEPEGYVEKTKEALKDVKARILVETAEDPLTRKAEEDCKKLLTAINEGKINNRTSIDHIVLIVTRNEPIKSVDTALTAVVVNSATASILSSSHSATGSLPLTPQNQKEHQANKLDANKLFPHANFFEAVFNGNMSIAEHYISKNKDLINAKDLQENTPLIVAAKQGHKEICEMLMKVGADPITRREFSQNALHNAAKTGHAHIIKILSSESVALNALDDNKKTPLMLAAESGHLDVCKILLEKKTDFKITDIDGRNALHLAALNGKIDVVTLFIEELITKKMLSTEVKDKSGQTALLLAALGGHDKICTLLLNAGVDHTATNNIKRTALHMAVEMKNREVAKVFYKFKELLSARDIDGITPLLMAATNGSAEIFERLLDFGSDPIIENNFGLNPMHAAIHVGNATIVRLLLPHKKLIDAKNTTGRTPLLVAAEKGKEEICEILLKANADPFATVEEGKNAMHLAAEKGRSGVVRNLISIKNLIDSKTKSGYTPLMLAAEKGKLEACKILLEAKANLLITKENNWNAMHIAAHHGKTDVVNLLSARKELINSRITSGQTPLMLAAEAGNQVVCEILLKAGADPILELDNGWNAMLLAINYGKNQVVKVLSSCKSLLNSKLTSGHTSLMLTEQYKKPEICDILLKAGADPFLTNKDGFNVMHIAVSKENIEIVKVLATNKKLVNEKGSKDGSTALMIAVEKGNLAICEILLKAGADLMTKKNDGWCALHLASKQHKPDLIKALLKHKNFFSSVDLALGNKRTSLMIAAETGKFECCESLLKAGADPAIVDDKGWNTMHLAAAKGTAEIIKILPKKLIDSTLPSGHTLLMIAAENGKPQNCEALLKMGAKADITLENNWNAMHHAVVHGTADAVKALFACEEIIDAETDDGKTPLMLAAEKGKLEICEVFLKRGADETYEKECWNAMHYAAHNGQVEIVRILAVHKQLLDSKTASNITPLMLSALKGSKAICEILLSAGANLFEVNNDGLNAIHYAAQNGNIPLIKWFLKKEDELFSSNKVGKSALILSVEKGNRNYAKILLKAEESPLFAPKDGWNALHFAAWSGDVDMLNCLLPHCEKDFDQITSQGKTALMLAIEKVNIDAIDILFRSGANLFDSKPNGFNAVLFAAKCGNIDILKRLLIYEQQLSRAPFGFYSLRIAIERENSEITDILLKAGADPFAVDQSGANALHHATLFGKSGPLKFLLVHAKKLINSKDWNGRTPLIWAAFMGFAEICEILLKAGADPFIIEEEYGGNAMHWAADEGKKEVVTLLLQHKQLINSKSKNGATPLMNAAQRGHLEICEILLKAGADPFAVQEGGYNAMHNAAKNGKTEIIKVLSAQKQLINSKDKAGFTPFMVAAENGYKEVCEVLSQIGADPFLVDNAGWNAIHFAAEHKHTLIVKWLLSLEQEKLSQNSNLTPSLMIAIEKQKINYLQTLLEGGANPFVTLKDGKNAMHIAAAKGLATFVKMLSSYSQLINSCTPQKVTPLMLAAEEGKIKTCQILLSLGADLSCEDSEGRDATFYAAKSRQVETLQALLIYEQTLTRNPYGYTALRKTILLGNSEICEVLLEVGADPYVINQDHWNAMHEAAWNGKAKVVNTLLKYSNLIESKTSSGQTPLLLAIENGKSEVCEVLLKASADPLAVNHNGFNAMHTAIKSGKSEIVKMLIANKTLINLTFKVGKDDTPLMLAAETGNQEICEILLKAGANPLATAQDGWNAMHMAAKSGNNAIVKLLAEFRSLIDSKNDVGNTPLMIAAETGNLEVCEVLVNAGANIALKNLNKLSAINLASNAQKNDIVKFLLACEISKKPLRRNEQAPIIIANPIFDPRIDGSVTAFLNSVSKNKK